MEFSADLISKYREYMFRVHKAEIYESQAQLDSKNLSNLQFLITEFNEDYAQRQSSESL